jgi:hypothetical protein
MNRGLLIWNVILTILMTGILFGGCSSIDPQFTNLQDQVKHNGENIQLLAKAINENSNLITEQSMSILEVKLYTETTINQLKTSLE